MANDDENRKATLPGDQVLSEIIRVSVKLDEMKRANADDKIVVSQRLTHIEHRLDAVENSGNRISEMARKAMKSASDLSEHVSSTEMATKAAVDSLSAGMGARMNEAETQLASLARETKAQTPMLHTLQTMLAEQNAYEKAKDKMKREAAETDAKERIRVAALHKRQMAWAGIVVGVLAIVVPAIMSYLGTKQANHDAPPQTIVVHEDGGK